MLYNDVVAYALGCWFLGFLLGGVCGWVRDALLEGVR